MKSLVLAINLMTVLPVKARFTATGDDYAASVGWFFLTGLMVGGVMALANLLVGLLGVSYLPALLAVVAGMVFTGALHVDGFADTCDAFFAGKPKQRTLEILKDSRQGTFGVIAIVFVIAVKTLLIAGTGNNISAILAAPVAGKAAMVFCAGLSAYPREDGLGKYIVEGVGGKLAFLSILLSGAVTVLLSGAWGFVAVALMLAVGFSFYLISKKKIGGATGDVLGAANEAGEIIFLLAAVAVS